MSAKHDLGIGYALRFELCGGGLDRKTWLLAHEAAYQPHKLRAATLFN